MRRKVSAWTLVACALPVGLMAQNYELAIASKLTEVQWKQEDLKAAERELAVIQRFLSGYVQHSESLVRAREDLLAAESRLAGIQQDNLVKLTIRMGIDTYNTVASTLNAGKAAAGALVTHGLGGSIGTLAVDQFTSSLTSEGQKVLGMDAASLSTPRTVKVLAVSEAARRSFPELSRVQRTLGLSLEAVKSGAFQQDGTELGDTGAILRKNIMVREEIGAAVEKLGNLESAALEGKNDAESQLPAVQADVDELKLELATLEAQLAVLRTDWQRQQVQELLAAHPIAEPVDLPLPVVHVEAEEGETAAAFALRVEAAIRAAALERWYNEAPLKLATIATLQDDIEALSGGLTASLVSEPTFDEVVRFVFEYGGAVTPRSTATGTYFGSLDSLVDIETLLAMANAATPKVASMLGTAEGLVDAYAELGNRQNQLKSLAALLTEAGAPVPGDYGTALETPGVGQEAAMQRVSELEIVESELPGAREVAEEIRDHLEASTGVWAGAIGGVADGFRTLLGDAERAYSALVAAAADWDALLAARPGMAIGALTGPQISRLGYFRESDFVFVPIVQRAFSLEVYRASLLAAVQKPGEEGLREGEVLSRGYDSLVDATTPLKDEYDAAMLQFMGTYADVLSFAPSYSVGILDDWSMAASLTTTEYPVVSPGRTDYSNGLKAWDHSLRLSHPTALDGGPPVSGQPVLTWRGITDMRQIEDPGMDDPEAYVPHVLLDYKRVIIEEGPGWIALERESFNTRYTSTQMKIWDMALEAEDRSDHLVKDAAVALMGELGLLLDLYQAAHPGPVIIVQPQGKSFNVELGGTAVATLSVTASGESLRYQWYVSRQAGIESGWEAIPDSNSSTLTTPALSESRWFKVEVSDGVTSVASEAVLVNVFVNYPAPVFTSAAAASATVGVPFEWRFTAQPTGWITLIDGERLPDGLVFNGMTGLLSGMPTVSGAFVVEVMANNFGAVASQSFQLSVLPAGPSPLDDWYALWTTEAQRALPAYTLPMGMPAGDGVANLQKYAFNLMGSGPGQQLALDRPNVARVAEGGVAGLPRIEVDARGRFVVLYLRRKSETSPGVVYVIEFSQTLAGDSWARAAVTEEVVSEIDGTWERVSCAVVSGSSVGGFVRVAVRCL